MAVEDEEEEEGGGEGGGDLDLLAKEVNKLVLNDGSAGSRDKEPPAEAC